MEFLSKSGLSFFKSLLDLYFATKSYVNKAISTNTGKFWGTYNSLADLQEITGSNGDYAYVIVPDDYSTSYDRYKWQDTQWVYEYTVGGEAFDDDQWAAINSGMTSADKTRLNEISDNIGNNSISEMRSDIDANTTALATKANVDGYYESMAVGQADNLKGQVLIPNDAAFRTSGGSEDVDSGIAHLQNIKGNTVSWNQLMKNPTMQNSHSDWYCGWNIVSETGSVITLNGVSGSVGFNTGVMSIIGHKYYISLRMKIDDDGGSDTPSFARVFYAGRSVSGNFTLGQFGIVRKITQAISADYIGFSFYPAINIRATIDKTFGVNAFDLTLIYGAGNEPTTVEQFESDYEKWFGKPLTYEPYNEGELIPAKTSALKTTGFNQWDEEWEMGTFDMTTGEKINSTNRVRSKNVIKIFPSTSYHFVRINNDSDGAIENILWYDSNMNFIKREVYVNNKTKISPDNAAYLNFNYYGTTYNHEICINLSHSGTRNGEYEPYESNTLQLPLTTLTGKLNGTGESVVVFPDGMKKAGSVQDEIYISGGKTYAVKRVGSVDLGSLDWVKGAGPRLISYNLLNAKSDSTYVIPNIINSRYVAIRPNVSFDTVNNVVTLVTSDKVNIYISDSSYSDAATFKSAMQGVMLYYELATPQVYELDDFKLPATFRVNDWGTEEQIHAEGVASVPATLANVYAMNAVDTINHLREEVTEIEGDITEMQSDIDANTSEIESHATQLQVEAEGLTQAHYELSAFEQIAQGKDEAVLPTLKAQTIDADEWISYGAPRVLISDVGGAPSAANIPTNWDETTMDVWAGYPRFIGQQYIDKTNKKLYVALALTGSVNDWVVMN